MTAGTLAQAAAADKPAAVADQIFRAGLEYCNAAARNSRTDSKQARSDFGQYLSELGRAKGLDPQFLKDNEFAARESHRCSLIGDDIARAEALPIMDKGLAMCQDARRDLDKGDIKSARSRFTLYRINRDRAIQRTETVMKVGSIALRVRTCDGLEDKIAQVKQQQASQKQLAALVLSNLKQANSICTGSSERMKGTMDTDQLAQIQDNLTHMQGLAQSADMSTSGLGALTGSRTLAQIQNLQQQVGQCQQKLTDNLAQARTRLQQQAEALAQAQAQTPAETEPAATTVATATASTSAESGGSQAAVAPGTLSTGALVQTTGPEL